ncbi:MAG: HlyD family secretion protein [Muribaculaceae bacterium]|nr:HlyD family secretion protein [Muribaculaceae bacterium]
MKNKKLTKRIYNTVIIVALLTFIALICSRFIHWGNVEYTDDAQVWRNIMPINARVGGFIKEVRFSDFQHVSKGDTLVIIEDAEFRLELAQAEANLRGSRSGSSAVSAGMSTTQSNVRTASANIDEARVQMENAQADFLRFEQLLAKNAVTRQQYDNSKARFEAAKARYQAAMSHQQATSQVLGEQKQRLGQASAGESVAEARLNLARLNLSYTVITASCSGIMSRKDIHVGQLVQPGQQLARIVDDNNVWVVANYRESQLRHISVGNSVDFTADALPGITFHGSVRSIAAGTGSAFSPIPVDNATGNFIKVEQRVPVRISLSDDNKPQDVARLLAGLNVETEVRF